MHRWPKRQAKGTSKLQCLAFRNKGEHFLPLTHIAMYFFRNDMSTVKLYCEKLFCNRPINQLNYHTLCNGFFGNEVSRVTNINCKKLFCNGPINQLNYQTLKVNINQYCQSFWMLKLEISGLPQNILQTDCTNTSKGCLLSNIRMTNFIFANAQVGLPQTLGNWLITMIGEWSKSKTGNIHTKEQW